MFAWRVTFARRGRTLERFFEEPVSATVFFDRQKRNPLARLDKVQRDGPDGIWEVVKREEGTP